MGISRISVLSLVCLIACGKVNDNTGPAKVDGPAAAKVTLTVTVVGPGAVTSNPAGINCSPTCTLSVDVGTQITLTPSAGTLASWSDPGCTGTDPCVLAMTADTAVTATFGTAKLTVTPAGAGTGTITSSPAGISCPGTCSASFTVGSTVTLTQTTTDANSRIGGWNGGGCTANGPCAVTMDAAKTVTSYFDLMLIDTAPNATSATSRTDGSAPTVDISAAAATVITELDGDISPSAACQVKFAVFDATSLALLYTSDAVNAPLGRSTVHSPPMNFAMVAGTKYHFVALTSVATSMFYFNNGTSTAGGLTTYGTNANASNFAAPTIPSASLAAANMHFQIWGHAQ